MDGIKQIWQKDRKLLEILVSHEAYIHATGEDGVNAFAICADGDTFNEYIFHLISDAGGRSPGGYGTPVSHRRSLYLVLSQFAVSKYLEVRFSYYMI